MKKNSIKRDIFISYSSKNFDEALAIREMLESNKLSCWMAPDDIPPGENYAEEIMKGLKAAKSVVLVFSKDSQDSIYVTNEIKTAFDMKKPIIAYKIDEALPEGKMEFYLKNKQWIDASVNPSFRDSFSELVEHANRLCKEAPVQKSNNSRFVIIAIAAVILIAAIGFFAFNGSGDTVSESVNSSEIAIDFIEMVDDSKSGYSWKYSYTVFGSIPSNLSNSTKDVVHIDFLDDSGNVVASNDTKVGQLNGNILGSAYINKNNVNKVVVELRDANGKAIASAESSDIAENDM